MTAIEIPLAAVAKLRSRVARYVDSSADPDACWPWTGAPDANGYGRASLTIDGRKVQIPASRAAFIVANGPLEPGQVVMHTCDNPPCCNPAHLRAGSQADNLRDMAEKGRARNSKSSVTHCPKGHPYSGDNLMLVNLDGRPWRSCRTCTYARTALYRSTPVTCPQCGAVRTRGNLRRHQQSRLCRPVGALG